MRHFCLHCLWVRNTVLTPSSERLTGWLTADDIAKLGFDYHVVSVFGSQSTGKSTLLNSLFGTNFEIMSENERRQTTRGIWMAKNRPHPNGSGKPPMAANILIMDVEGTDGRERGEDQDFERKAALFALATSEVLIINIWEHQVGLYQGANMGLLKVVFEVNLGLFLKGKSEGSTPRSLLFFVIRDHLGTTPLSNLRNTLATDLTRIWASIDKPEGMERSKIDDYFDFAFAALPHKILQPEKFSEEVLRLGARFREGKMNQKTMGSDAGLTGGVFIPQYHRRVPADGFPVYAHGVWDQIVNNKDLDLPTQQELLAQFRCDEIMREVLVVFDEKILPHEQKQSIRLKSGKPVILKDLGSAMRSGRTRAIEDFTVQASRYLKPVYIRKRTELENKLDVRLQVLFSGQLTAVHKDGIAQFTDQVTSSVKANQRKGAEYDFGKIVLQIKKAILALYEREAEEVAVEGAPWSDYSQEYQLFQQEIDDATSRLRREELRRLAGRVDRWIRTRLAELVGHEFNSLGSARSATVTLDPENQPVEKQIWDRVWKVFVSTVESASSKFSARARSFDASPEELSLGLWQLRRSSWSTLRSKIEEEMMEGNLLLRLRENFEDKFRYDEAGVPRIWRPTDNIEGLYMKARESTLALIPLLASFELSSTKSPPPLVDWIGKAPSDSMSDEEDVPTIGGTDFDDGKSLEDEMTLLSDSKRQELTTRFKKAADGVYVEAKRSAVGGMTQVPLYFYGLLLALGWNEILAGSLSLHQHFRGQTLTLCSTSEPNLLHIPDSPGGWGVRHVHFKSVGADVQNGERCLGSSRRGIQEEVTRVFGINRNRSTSDVNFSNR